MPVEGAVVLPPCVGFATPLPDMPIAERPLPDMPIAGAVDVGRGADVVVWGAACVVACKKQPKVTSTVTVHFCLAGSFTEVSSMKCVIGAAFHQLFARLMLATGT